VLFLFFILSDKEAKSKWNVWNSKEAFAQAEALGRIPQTTIPEIERKSDIKRLIIFSAAICLIFHPLLWLVLFLRYPVSRRIRVIFFWNPYVRKIMGLGYIHLLLTKLPYFRQKLFEPFRGSLLTDAALDDFDDAAYFKHSEVKVENLNLQETLRIQEAIPEIKGQIILEGESGLGKSMFARYLLKHSKRVTVYLPAEKCSKGVIEAIQPKLRGEVKDIKFLRQLIYAGAIDICIDGLNRVNENHAKTIQFMVQSFKGNILVTTQSIDWTAPATAKTYILQPLRRDHIEEFLINCYQIFPEHIVFPRSEYVRACQDYIADMLDEHQPQEVLDSAQRILSNPMNLTMVALLGAYEIEPDLLYLQEQYYQMMVEEYEQIHQDRLFPLVRFSERMYQMRFNDEATLPQHRFPDEIACMERYNMVLSRQSFDAHGNPVTERYFRHDKIMEFFIVQAFPSTNHNHRFERHFKEPRFQGVYSLLETLLPPDKMSQVSQLRAHKQKKLEDAKKIEMGEIRVFYTYKDIVRLEKTLNPGTLALEEI